MKIHYIFIGFLLLIIALLLKTYLTSESLEGIPYAYNILHFKPLISVLLGFLGLALIFYSASE